MVTDRIKKIKDISMDLDQLLQYIPFQKIDYEPDPADDVMLRFQKAFEAVMDQVEPRHIPGSRFAGNGGEKFYARPSYFIKEDIDQMRDYPKGVSENILESINESCFYLLPYEPGHTIEDIPTTLREGIQGITARIEARMQDENLTEHQRAFLKTALNEWNAVRRCIKRHVEFYEGLAKAAKDPEEKREYQEIAATLTKVPEHPATSFREALQSVWFVYYCSQMDDVANHSLGRLDQYLYPYYKKDIESKLLNPEEARELLYDFWLKYSAGYTVSEVMGRDAWKGIADYEDDAHDGLGWLVTKIIDDKHVDDGHTVELAGLTEEGKDAVNDLSWMMLDAVLDLRSIEPKPVVKLTDQTDARFMDACYRTLEAGTGFPAIAYDGTLRKAMSSEPGNHYTEADLINTCHIGCIEPAVPGKSYVDPMNAWVNLLKILSVTLNNGTVNGKKIGLELKKPESFEEFLNGYYRQMRHFIDLYVEGANAACPFYNRFFFRPMTSTLVQGCVENALPLDEGGAAIWNKSMNCCGLASTVDSLAAIRQVVYEQKLKTLEELNDILNRNYEGEEEFRQFLLNKVPKFGNGDARVDELAADLIRNYCEYVYSKKTFNGSYYRPGAYSFYRNPRRQGEATPATPDGRKAGQMFSLNIAPAHGSIRQGLTGALQSITAFDHSLPVNACPIDVQLSGNTPSNVIRYIDQYIEQHGGQLTQYSVANRDDLLAAQKEPEKYKDLIVRVTGFSARFVALDRQTQDEILQRSYWS